jgi:hypothetical protein
VANFLYFPQRFGLVCRFWQIEPSGKKMQDALGVDGSVLSRWANFTTQRADSDLHPESKLTVDFLKYLADSKALALRGYTASEFSRCFTTYDDKKFLQFLVARSLPASVLELSQPKFDQMCAALLEQNDKARYFMYRLGTFEDEDLAAFPDPAQRRALLGARPRVLRRVPAHIERLNGESFLLYREAYRLEASIGSVFHVDTHFTIWGQDYNDNTSELFLITIKRPAIPFEPFTGLFVCAILMLGDGDRITACKALMRRVPDKLAQIENKEFELFARESQRTIVLAADASSTTGYRVDTTFSQELIEPEFEVRYDTYADYLSIRDDAEAIVLR